MTLDKTKILGSEGEKLAESFLKKKATGYWKKITGINWVKLI